MNVFILNTPIELRLLLLFLLGTLVGSFVNLGIYRLAWTPRAISPWSRPDAKAPPRQWADWLPVVGWFFRAREAGLHVRGFWVRPLLIELSLGLLFAWLYWWEIVALGLVTPPLPVGFPAAPDLLAVLHWQYASHVVLVALLSMAAWIDIDEKIIPDTVTIPGTLAGLLLAALAPRSLLPANVIAGPAAAGAILPPILVEPLTIASPEPWPAVLDAAPQTLSLCIALGCWLVWCFALMPRRWITRRGFAWSWRFFVGRLRRETVTYQLAGLAVAGALAIAAAWQWANALSWQGLLTALVGMTAGGAVVWVVRIVGRVSLGKEAMGFGDVTLLAMIGTFVGWQSCLMIFFLAPFAALLIAIGHWLLHRDNEIPYGPFLALATLASIVFWARIWEAAAPVFAVGWLVPAVVAVCMVLMLVMLGLWRLLRKTLWGGR